MGDAGGRFAGRVREVITYRDVATPGAAGQQFLGYAGVNAWRDAEVVNVRGYGILGDGTDETAKAQSLFDAIRTGVQKRRHVHFPEPQNGTHYHLTDTLTVNLNQTRISGARRERTTLRMATANKPILLWNDDSIDGNNANSCRIDGLHLEFETAPTAATDQQYAIQFRARADPTVFSTNGYFYFDFADLRTRYAFVGIGTYATTTGGVAVWSSRFENVHFRDTLRNAIKLASGGTAVGQPHNTIAHVDVINYDPALLSDGEAVRVTGGTGLVIDHLNVEDWQNRILYVTGGSYCVVNGLRTERHDVTVANQDLIYLANGEFVLNGVDFRNIYVHNATGLTRCIKADTDARVVVNGMEASRSTTGSTTTQGIGMLEALNGATIVANAVAPGTGATEYLDSTVNDGLYGRVRVGGLPPKVNALPAAGATYRGREFAIEGGVGVADATYRCEKNAADAYVWTAI